jgi:hypothetical protein
MKIAFFIRHFGERGTEVAAYEYAHYNETLLGNQSIIIGFTPETYQKHGLACIPDVLSKFRDRFQVFLVESYSEVDTVLRNESVNVYYTLTAGTTDGERPPFGLPTYCKSVVHCVFHTNQPHGDIYAAISPQLNIKFETSVPVIPHIVATPPVTGCLRESLGIPSDAIVFGRHGGYDTFDIREAHMAIIRVARSSPSTYFLFMNTPRFCDLPNVIHLPMTIDPMEKQRFINTCDAYLHARSHGETFGLAIAEFAVCKKPIIAYNRCSDDAHLRILKDKIYLYSSSDDLIRILQTFRKGAMNMDNNGYMDFSPERVMEQFKRVVCDRTT